MEVNSLDDLMKIFDWSRKPILARADIHDYDFEGDANNRRVHDAEVLGVVMRNVRPATALEIGTAAGMGTVLMSVNSPKSKIYTINILEEDLKNDQGGKYTTIALSKEMIGREYRKQKRKNVFQIYANTATWEPNIGEINGVFIDGCHDTEFVVNDTKKILGFMPKGSFIVWHDFCPGLRTKFAWIDSVCLGVESLYESGYLSGKIYHLKDSWTGIYFKK